MKTLLFSSLLVFLTFVTYTQPYFQRISTGIVATDAGSYTMSAWGDYDNNGFQDLAVVPWNDGCWSCSSPVLLYKNDGNGTFSRGLYLMGEVNLSCNGVSWGDYTNDGKLDLYITRYFSTSKFLFRNDATVFTNILSGNIVTDLSSSTGNSWADYNKDGWIDMFVSNGQNQNNALYKNNGDGTFTKITTGAIVNDGGDSRSCGWGDYDNDSWPDLFVVNYSGQNCFLYKNNGNGTFTKITNVAPVQFVGWGAGCSWADYDNDGWLDLMVTYNNDNNRLYHNERNGTFSLTNLAPSQESGWSFYPAWGDINNDGYIDLFVTNGSTPNPLNNFLYQNVTVNSNKYTVLKLAGCILNRSAIGTKVTVVAGGKRLTRVVQGGGGSQSMLWPHFGLGNATIIDSIIVDWTTGNRKILTNVAVNQFLNITECPLGIVNNQLPLEYELKQNYPNPFNPSTQIEYSLLKSGMVNLSIYDASGKLVKNIVSENQSFGTYRYDFDASNLSSGIYIYKLRTNDFADTKKMVFIK